MSYFSYRDDEVDRISKSALMHSMTRSAITARPLIVLAHVHEAGPHKDSRLLDLQGDHERLSYTKSTSRRWAGSTPSHTRSR